jgi:TonB family protein
MILRALNQSSIRISLILHIAVIFIIGIYFLVQLLLPEREQHVFTLSDIDSTDSVPEVSENITITKAPDKSDIIKKDSNLAPKKVDYDTFLKEHPKKQKTQPKNRVITKVPDFNLNKSISLTEPSITSNYDSLLLDYQNYLYQTLNSKWLKPSSKFSNLEVLVEFTVLKNGEIQNVKILKSSGIKEFDQSIIAVFARIQKFKPAPNNKENRFRMAFRID